MDQTGMDQAGSPADEAGQVQDESLGAASVAWTFGGPGYIPYRVLILAKMLDRLATRMLQSTAKVSLAEWRSLTNLALFEPASVRRIAENAWVDRAEVSRALAGLEQRGLVRRTENPKDRRSPIFSLSDEGRTLVDDITPLRRAFHKDLTSRLTEEERAALERGLRILAERCVAELEGVAET